MEITCAERNVRGKIIKKDNIRNVDLKREGVCFILSSCDNH